MIWELLIKTVELNIKGGEVLENLFKVKVNKYFENLHFSVSQILHYYAEIHFWNLNLR